MPRSYPSSSLDWGKPACLSSRFRSGFGAAGVLGGEQFSTARPGTLRVNGRLREGSMTCSAVAFRAVRSVRFAGSVVISFLHVGVVPARIGAGCGVLAALPDPSGGPVRSRRGRAGVRHR